MRLFLLAATLIAALLIFSTSATSRAVVATPEPPSESGEAAAAASDGTLILSVSIDARGVDVELGTRKPALRYRRHRNADRMPFRWVLRAADGDALATGGFDPGPMDLDPAHFGREPEAQGDFLVPTRSGMNIKIPDIPHARIEFELRSDGVQRPFGVTQFGSYEVRGMMRLTATLALTMGCAGISPAQIVNTVVSNGDPSELYDIVILGDGYQASEQATFDIDVGRVLTVLQSNDGFPHNAYFGCYNVHSVFRASVDSGADDPVANHYVNTVYHTSYGVGGTQRCLYIAASAGTSQANADAALAPDTDGRVVILVNDSQYGGCASSFSVSYNGSSMQAVQIHEWGHSFGGLADEYDYDAPGTYSGPEFLQPNVSNSSIGNKWAQWLGFAGQYGTVGAHEGARYYEFGVWRPEPDCMMRNLNRRMCTVCREHLIKRFHQECVMIGAPQPAGPSSVSGGSTVSFSFTNRLASRPHTIEWRVDGGAWTAGGANWSWVVPEFGGGQHLIEVRLTDTSPQVLNDPGADLVHVHTWTVDVLGGQAQPGVFALSGQGCPASFPLFLFPSGEPLVGHDLTVRAVRVPANASSVSLMVGLSQLDADLDFIGMEGCDLLQTVDVGVIPANTVVGTLATWDLPMTPNTSAVGLTLETQAIAIAPGVNTLGVITSNRGTLTLGLEPVRVVVECSGVNTFNANTSSGFFRVINLGNSPSPITGVTFDWAASNNPAHATTVFDTDQGNMAGRFDGGNSASCPGTYRNASDVITGLDYAGSLPSGCDPAAMTGWTTSGSVGAENRDVTFGFTDFAPGETFEVDIDTDGGPGTAGGDMAGMVVIVTFADGTMLANYAQTVSANSSRVAL